MNTSSTQHTANEHELRPSVAIELLYHLNRSSNPDTGWELVADDMGVTVDQLKNTRGVRKRARKDVWPRGCGRDSLEVALIRAFEGYQNPLNAILDTADYLADRHVELPNCKEAISWARESYGTQDSEILEKRQRELIKGLLDSVPYQADLQRR